MFPISNSDLLIVLTALVTGQLIVLSLYLAGAYVVLKLGKFIVDKVFKK